MKIKKKQLKKLIQEEVKNQLNEEREIDTYVLYTLDGDEIIYDEYPHPYQDRGEPYEDRKMGEITIARDKVAEFTINEDTGGLINIDYLNENKVLQFFKNIVKQKGKK